MSWLQIGEKVFHDGKHVANADRFGYVTDIKCSGCSNMVAYDGISINITEDNTAAVYCADCQLQNA